jgi:prevent-host-death family protein
MVMTTESLADVKANLSRYVDQVEQQHERVTITRNGRPAAVLISPEDLAVLEDTLAVLSDPETMHQLAENERAWDRGEYTDQDDMAKILRERAAREAGAA